MTRSQLQEKINTIKTSNPTITFNQLVDQLELYLDGFDLSNEIYDHLTMKQRVLDDLNSYEGVTNG